MLITLSILPPLATQYPDIPGLPCEVIPGWCMSAVNKGWVGASRLFKLAVRLFVSEAFVAYLRRWAKINVPWQGGCREWLRYFRSVNTSFWIRKGVSATLQNGRYTLSYLKGRTVSHEMRTQSTRQNPIGMSRSHCKKTINHSKHETLNQCWFKAGQPSVGQL